ETAHHRDVTRERLHARQRDVHPQRRDRERDQKACAKHRGQDGAAKHPLDDPRPDPVCRPTSCAPSAQREPSLLDTVSDPRTDTATTRMVPVARDVNVGEPPRYMPPIAIITVTPETSTARPDVAAAASIAAPFTRPAARSSRTRLR